MKRKLFRLIRLTLRPLVFIALAAESEFYNMKTRLRKEFKNNEN